MAATMSSMFAVPSQEENRARSEAAASGRGGTFRGMAPLFQQGAKQARRTLRCRDCDTDPPNLIEDHASGDMICMDCGLVVEERIVDEHSEWRTFTGEGTSHNDPNRIGGTNNPLLLETGLSTTIAKQSSNILSTNLSRYQNRATLNGVDKRVIVAFQEIARMSDRIGLPQRIRDKANELYTKVDSKVHRRKIDGYVAAALYMACRFEGVPRTIKEICALTSVSKKTVGRAYKVMREVLREQGREVSVISTADFMKRFCSNLGLDMDQTNIASQIAKQAVVLGVVSGRSPISVAAASIWYAVTLKHVPVTAAEIASITGVAEVTIKSTYKDLQAVEAALLADVSLDAKRTKSGAREAAAVQRVVQTANRAQSRAVFKGINTAVMAARGNTESILQKRRREAKTERAAVKAEAAAAAKRVKVEPGTEATSTSATSATSSTSSTSAAAVANGK